LNLSTAKEFAPNDLLSALQSILKNYLNEKPSRSLNGLSKKCTVSEPTLRRIFKGQIKTLPTATTILDILTTLSGEKNTALIAKNFPGPIADYLESIIPQAQEFGTEYDSELNTELKDPVKYIIYKLAANSSGLRLRKLNELFGRHGVSQAESLIQKGYLHTEGGVLFTKVKDFTINHESFVNNFKIVADYIKTQNPLATTNLYSLLANYSESVTADAYKDIISLQKRTLQKIRKIMSEPSSKGSIPLFLLLAIDTLDTQPAQDYVLEKTGL
jgi:hypothetical protein